MKRVKIISVVALLAIATIVTSCKEEVQPQMSTDYKTLTASKSTTSVSTLYTASIRGEQFVDIRPQVSGTITKIAITEGAKITKGQTLFVIDQVPYTAAVDAANAAVSSAEAAVENPMKLTP